ncbi:MAG: hypothetical protein M1832_005167 [Thelocarpon impressellum]|nr:MAG: hypothetical protein M1832_005167 [Thelocarpon impressellum]
MTSRTVNGDGPHLSLASVNHFASYPLISDTISTFKSNPYGQKSLSLADQIYATFAKPLYPYLSGPYQYVSPYVSKADSLADSGLSKVEQTFPIVKQPTGQLRNSVTDVAFLPLRKATEGKDYVLNTYSSEYGKVGGDGLLTAGKAVISTGLVVTSDSLGWLSSFLSAKKDDAKKVAGQAQQKAGQKKEQAKQAAH